MRVDGFWLKFCLIAVFLTNYAVSVSGICSKKYVSLISLAMIRDRSQDDFLNQNLNSEFGLRFIVKFSSNFNLIETKCSSDKVFGHMYVFYYYTYTTYSIYSPSITFESEIFQLNRLIDLKITCKVALGRGISWWEVGVLVLHFPPQQSYFIGHTKLRNETTSCVDEFLIRFLKNFSFLTRLLLSSSAQNVLYIYLL